MSYYVYELDYEARGRQIRRCFAAAEGEEIDTPFAARVRILGAHRTSGKAWRAAQALNAEPERLTGAQRLPRARFAYHAFKPREQVELSSGGRALLKGRTGDELTRTRAQHAGPRRPQPVLSGMFDESGMGQTERGAQPLDYGVVLRVSL